MEFIVVNYYNGYTVSHTVGAFVKATSKTITLSIDGIDRSFHRKTGENTGSTGIVASLDYSLIQDLSTANICAGMYLALNSK